MKRTIQGVTYEIGERNDINAEIVLIEERWFRTIIPDSKIGFDYDKKEWDLINNISKQKVLYDGVRKVYSSDKSKSKCVASDIETYLYNFQTDLRVLNEKAAELGYYLLSWNNNMYINENLIKTFLMSNKLQVNNRSYPYNVTTKSLEKLNNTVKSYDPTKSKSFNEKEVELYTNLLKNYTYGFEIETSAGIVPDYTNNILGIIPLRDGSINGIEYATNVLEATASDVLRFGDILLELQGRCTVDYKCGIHVNIGNIPKNDTNILSLYHLFSKLHNELMTTCVLPYRSDSRYYAQKDGKNHCRPLPLINYGNTKDQLKTIYRVVSGDRTTGPNNSVFEGVQKWEQPSRYYGFNLIKYLFSDANIIEFRHLHPTLDKYEILNFASLCAAMINFAIKYPNYCVESKYITLSDVIMMSNLQDDLQKHLMKYIEDSARRDSVFKTSSVVSTDNWLNSFGLIEKSDKYLTRYPKLSYLSQVSE